MAVLQELRDIAGRPAATLGREPCPRCGEPRPLTPPVPAFTLGGLPVVRCGRCGTRSAPAEWPFGARRLVFSCECCGLPFLAGSLLPHGDQRCETCRSGYHPAGLPDSALAEATEAEVGAALGDIWRFLGSERLSAYLDRIARHVASRLESAPQRVRVLLVDDRRARTLALPSGTLLVSLGTVAFLEDEAELAFVLGHELAHAGSGDAALRLVRLGFHAVARSQGGHTRARWGEAALDLVRLGYGRRRERDADARSLEAMLALGYDPASVRRYLGRLQERIEAGDPSIAELAAAHPPAGDRARRLACSFYGRVPDGVVVHVNRELFRRAAGAEALARLGVQPPPFQPLPADPERSGPDEQGGTPFWAKLATLGLAVAALFLLVFLLLRA